jgi:hypothetical protein
MSEEAKQAVLDYFEKSSAKGKKKMYPKDVAKSLEEQFPKGDTKQAIQDLIAEDKMAYWSSGSTTYVMLKKDFDELTALTD